MVFADNFARLCRFEHYSIAGGDEEMLVRRPRYAVLRIAEADLFKSVFNGIVTLIIGLRRLPSITVGAQCPPLQQNLVEELSPDSAYISAD
jgi:hypothetical protein